MLGSKLTLIVMSSRSPSTITVSCSRATPSTANGLSSTGNEHVVCGAQGVDREQTLRGRTIEGDVIVMIRPRSEHVGELLFAIGRCRQQRLDASEARGAGMRSTIVRHVAKNRLGQRGRTGRHIMQPGPRRQQTASKVVAPEWLAKYSATWAVNHGDRVIRRFERDIFSWIGGRPVAGHAEAPRHKPAHPSQRATHPLLAPEARRKVDGDGGLGAALRS